MVDKNKVVKIFGEEYPLLAQVEVLNGFSGHADRDELLGWVEQMKQKPRQTYLVHGEEESAFALKASLEEAYGLKVTVPELGDSFDV
jgi:metallo-beta-lactamase family protein